MKSKKTTEKLFHISVKMVIYFFLIIILFFLASKGFSFGRKIFSEKGYEDSPGEDIEISISASDSKMDVAKKLVSEGVIEDKWVYYIQSVLYEAKYQTGTFTLNNSMSGEKIIEELSSKKEEVTTSSETTTQETTAQETTSSQPE